MLHKNVQIAIVVESLFDFFYLTTINKDSRFLEKIVFSKSFLLLLLITQVANKVLAVWKK